MKKEDLCYLLPKKKKKTFKSAKTAAKLLKQERNIIEQGCCRHKEHHQLIRYSDSLILNLHRRPYKIRSVQIILAIFPVR
ncbi:unnamed protein product [Brassica oleracea]